MIHLFVQAENRNARLGETIGNRALHRSGTAILGQQAPVHIHRTVFCHGEDILREDGIGDNDKQVRTEGTQIGLEFRGLQIERLQYRESVFKRELLYRRGRQHAATPRGPIGLGYHAHNFQMVRFL